MDYLYYYRAASGFEIPCLYAGDPDRLYADFTGSATPVVRVVPLTGPEVRTVVLNVLEAHLTTVPKHEAGLRFHLAGVVAALKGHPHESAANVASKAAGDALASIKAANPVFA